MLILFIYIASLASNEKLKFNPLNVIKINLLTLILLIIYVLFDKFYILNYFNNTDISLFSDQTFLINENHLALSKIYDSPNNFIIILIINYLLLTLIIIVKITNLFQGPLRPKRL